MPSVIQRNFAGGEIAPALYARADQVKYVTGLKACRNFIVARHGGVFNRPGTEFVCEVKDSSKAVRLLKFVFNAEQTYVLEFGDLYMRVIRDGALVESSPGVPFEIATPYLEADLAGLQTVQSGDVVTIVHNQYAPRELARTSHTSWTLTEIAFSPSLNGPLNCEGAKGAAGSRTYRYRITAVKADTYEESLPGYEASKTITAATRANPVVITSALHGYTKGDEVVIDGIVGMTELNGRTFRIGTVGANTFELKDENGASYTAYASGGTVARTHITITSAAVPTDAAPHILAWDDVAGAVEYNIYKEQNGVYGYAGTTSDNIFEDENIEPDTSDTPPIARDPFETGGYPGAVAYYQQRQAFASSPDQPEKVWFSKTADFHNFTIRSPIQDDDAVTFTIAGRQVNQVRHIVEIGKLVIFTSGGEWTVDGDSDGVLRPTAVNLRQQGYNGSSPLPPIIISNSALFVQARGSVVRDLHYDLESDGYAGRDLTVFAAHLFDGYTLADWDYQQIPHSVVWAVRSDGVLLGLTYMREHEVWGWHRHDSPGTYGGSFENVCVVPEGEEDAPYFVVRRTINGSTRRYIERMHSRRVTDVAVDAYFVDCGLTYDGRNTSPSLTMTLSGGTEWLHTENLTLTSSLTFFSAGDVGNAIVLTSGSDTVTLTITGYTSGTVVTVTANKTVPVPLRSTAIGAWSEAVDGLAGLGHLEGETVNILGDGHVLPSVTVSGGAISLPEPHSVVHVGIPIQSDFETLEIDNPQGPTLLDKPKLFNKVTLFVEAARGLFSGTDAAHLREYKQRSSEAYGEATRATTGNVEVITGGTWSQNARVFVRQSDPLPLTILAAIPRGIVGGDN